eukprot:gene1486-biopygen2234
MIRIEDVEGAEPDEDQEGVEAGGDAERGEHGGARRQAVARQRGWSKAVPSRRMLSTGDARRMTQVLKPCPRQERQGRLRKANDGVEEKRRARKDRDPRKMTEGTQRILNIKKVQIMKKLPEGCRISWQTQADAEKLSGLLKMESIPQAQKAVGTPGHWRWGTPWTTQTTQRGLECAGYVVGADNPERNHRRLRKRGCRGKATAGHGEPWNMLKIQSTLKPSKARMTGAGNGRPQRAVDFHGARGVSGVRGFVDFVEEAEYPESAEYAEYAECTIEFSQLCQSIEEAAAAEDRARRRGPGGARRTQGLHGRRGLR